MKASAPTGITLLLSALAIGGGCAQTETVVPADYHLSYNLPLQDRATLSRPLDESALDNVSAKIYLLSDNQRHEVLGDRVDFFRNSFSDYYTKVAIRPPQLDVFGQDLLVEALKMTDGFVLHLGDACDVSNTGEFGRFAWDMRHAKDGWVMAPGNHDGFFFGNSSRTRENLIQEWNDSAEAYDLNGTSFESRAMQKDRYVSFYLAILVLQDKVWSAPLASALGGQIENRLALWSAAQDDATFSEYWTELVALEAEIYDAADSLSDNEYRTFELPEQNSPPGRPHLRRIAWQINKEKVWQSFILQELDITASAEGADDPERVSILVIDSSHYGIQPSLDHGAISKVASIGGYDVQVAGEHGNILESQEAAAQTFAASMQAEDRSWLLASHHPYSDLGRATPPKFNDLRSQGQIPVTLSAHTHAGEIRLNYDEDGMDHWLEINVGSLLDSPVEYRDFQLHRIDGRLAVRSQRQLMEIRLRELGLMADEIPGYRPSPGDPDYYLEYRKGITGLASDADYNVKKVLLAAYLRMLRLFEADDPDQSTTYWPKGPNGEPLDSHQAVVEAVEKMLTESTKARVGELTQFLYELQEFERTRNFSDATGERLRAYRLSQAIWASRTERRVYHGGTTAIDPDISFLILPRPSSDAPPPSEQ